MPNFDKTWQLLRPYTMVKYQRYLTSLRLALSAVDVPGDIVETGVWRGGMIAGIARTLGNDRHYHLFDSFRGLPEADLEIDGAKAVLLAGKCSASERSAVQAMTIAGVNNYEIHAGWFKDTLPEASFPSGIALLRLDADWFQSTTQCLEALYPQVNPGGVVIIDDYHYWRGCRRAVHDYLTNHNVSDTVRQAGIDPVAYIIKED